MSEETPAPGVPTFEYSRYLASVAAKKVSWAIAKLIIAKGSTQGALIAWGTISDALKKMGITIIIDPSVLNAALPGIIFAGLVALHDYAKVKTDWKWL